MRRKKRAFTLVEILGVAAIIGILITASAMHLNTVWRNNQIDICESELREISIGFKSYFTDYGTLTIKNDLNYEAVLAEALELLNRQYLPCELQSAQIAVDKKSVLLHTRLKVDPWNEKYKIVLYTYGGDDRDSITGLVIAASSGPDRKSSVNTYKSGNYGDDIIAVIEPK